MEKIKNILWYWLPLVCYMGLIFYVSHQSDPMGATRISINDKVMHFLEYIPLSYLFLRVLRRFNHGFLIKHCMMLAIVCAALYACSDEFHQMYIPLREASLLDLTADIAGSVVGVLLMRRLTI